MAKVEVLIDGVAVEFTPGTLSVNQQLGGRSTAEFRLVQEVSVLPPGIGESVVVQKDGVRLFGGQIHSVPRRIFPGQNYTEYQYECTDWHQILDRRLAGDRTFVGQLAGDIARTLVTAMGEGFTSVGVEDGPTIDRLELRYPTMAVALSKIAEAAGMRYAVDGFKDVKLVAAPVTANAPFGITSVPETNNCRRLNIRSDREQYVNKVVLNVGEYVLDPREEEFSSPGRTGGDPDPEPEYATDGARKSFVVTFPIHTEPTVRVDGVLQTVGIGEVETGKDWYWNAGSRDIVQDDAATALSAAQTLTVEYVGLSSATFFAEDAGAIADRSTVEGGSGFYEELIEPSSSLTAITAQQLAASTLARRSQMSFTADYETDEVIEPTLLALEVGQLQEVARAGYAADGDYLVRSIRWSDRKGVEQLFASVTAVKGPFPDDAVSFFGRAGGSGGGSVNLSGSASSEASTAPAYDGWS